MSGRFLRQQSIHLAAWRIEAAKGYWIQCDHCQPRISRVLPAGILGFACVNGHLSKRMATTADMHEFGTAFDIAEFEKLIAVEARARRSDHL